MGDTQADVVVPPIPDMKGRVPVLSPGGQVQFIRPELASKAAAVGYQKANDGEVKGFIDDLKTQRYAAIGQQHDADRKKIVDETFGGDAGGSATAGILGYASGLTGGLAPSLYAKAAGALTGGDSSFIKGLYADVNKEHSTANTVGEFIGSAHAMAIGSGAASGLLKGTAIAGKLAEAGGLAKTGLAAASAGIDNAYFGAQHDINESMLENKPLVAEHFLADRGVDFLVGGAFGAALHGVGLGGKYVFGKGKEQVSKWAGKDIGELGNSVASRDVSIPDGRLGEGGKFEPDIQKYVGEKILPEMSLKEATNTKLFDIAEKNQKRAGDLLNTELSTAGKIQSELHKTYEPQFRVMDEIPALGEKLTRYESLAGEQAIHAPEVNRLRGELQDAIEQSNAVDPSVRATRINPTNITNEMRVKAAEFRKHPGQEWEHSANWLEKEADSFEKTIRSDSTIDKLWEERVQYDKSSNRNKGIPNEAIEAARGPFEAEIRRVTEALGKVDPRLEKLPTTYMDLQKEYAITTRISEARGAFESSLNATTSKGIAHGVYTATIGLLSGHPLGSLMSLVGTPIIERQMKERGSLLAAKALKKLASINALRSTADAGEAAIESTVRSRLGETKEALGYVAKKAVNMSPRLILGAGDKQSTEKAYFQHIDNVTKLAANPKELERRLSLHVGSIHDDAPETSGQMMDQAVRIMGYLSHAAGANDGRDPYSPTAHLEPRSTSPGDIAQYTYKVMGAMYPKTTIEAMMQGTAPGASVDALRVVWPNMYKQTATALMKGLGNMQKPLSSSQRRTVTSVTGVAAGYSQKSQTIAFYQELHAGMDNQEEQNQAASRVRKVKDLQKPFETTMQSLSQK